MTENEKKYNKPLQDQEFKEIHKVWNQTEAEIIKSFLESQGISCLIKGRIVQNVYPFTTDGLGEIKIFVLEKDCELAKKLLENHE